MFFNKSTEKLVDDIKCLLFGDF